MGFYKGGVLWLSTVALLVIPAWSQWGPPPAEEPPMGGFGQPWASQPFNPMGFYPGAPNALQPGPTSFLQYGASAFPASGAYPANFRFRAQHEAEDEEDSEETDTEEDSQENEDEPLTPAEVDTKGDKDDKTNPALTSAFVTVATTNQLANEQTVPEANEAACPEPCDKDPLDVPLEDIKQQIIQASKKVKEEQKWVGQVQDVMTKYQQKVDNVKKDMDEIRQNIKTLLIKKRQIQNLKLQKQLQVKLDDANADMSTLETALNHVQTKQDNFVATKEHLQDTIDGLNKALLTLKGEPLPEEQPADDSETLSEAMLETHEANEEAQHREQRVEAELAGKK